MQLSRGKAEAQLLFEITLLTQDLGRLAADLLLFYSQEFGYVSLPEAFTTGSSIMPQKRNPDVFELMRGRSAVAQAALNEVLGITQKLTSGYQRDLQLIKPPLFRGIDSCLQTLAILPSALSGVRFGPENIRLDPNIHAAAAANALVAKEGIPFREAYRRVAAKLKERIRMSIWRSLRTIEELNGNRRRDAASGTSVFCSPKSARTSSAAPCPWIRAPRSPMDFCMAAPRWRSPKPWEAWGRRMCVDAAEYQVVGQEINANHVRAARSGLVTGTARAGALGRPNPCLVDRDRQ